MPTGPSRQAATCYAFIEGPFAEDDARSRCQLAAAPSSCSTTTRPGQRILNTIQTNGTLLDDEWGAFLKEHEFLAGISVDGPAEIHDDYRVDKGGKPSFARVIRGLDVLKRHGVDWNVLTTVHAVNADAGRRVYTFLRVELGARFIQFLIDVFEELVRRATSTSSPATCSATSATGTCSNSACFPSRTSSARTSVTPSPGTTATATS